MASSTRDSQGPWFGRRGAFAGIESKERKGRRGGGGSWSMPSRGVRGGPAGSAEHWRPHSLAQGQWPGLHGCRQLPFLQVLIA